MNLNDVCHGFVINNIRDIEEIHGTLYEMTHLKTGARTIWLKRDDENKTFSIAFKTTPEDDTGVFHILEHSVLNGSDRYPVREPFVDLLKGSLQTFLNAMTYPDKTVYPVSSRNNQDFINLMRVYLDAVFHPLAKSNPNIFRQEGWHYELFDKDADLIYKGVVFNEMKGAFSSPDGVKNRLLMHQLFPDTSYGNESGGDPEYITDLTWERFCHMHDKYYNPSNSFIFLDGNMDIEKILGIIDDEYLSHYDNSGERIEFVRQQPVISEPLVQEYEISPTEDPENKTHLTMGFVVSDFNDNEKKLAYSLIASVLCGSNESPLKKAVLEKGLAEDIYMSIEDGIYQPYVVIDAVNTDEKKLDELRETIISVLKKSVEEGLDKAELESTLNQKEFKEKEKDFGTAPKGLVFTLTALDTWLFGGDPIDSLQSEQLFTFLREKINTSYYGDLIQEGILDSSHKAEIILIPSTTLGQKKTEKEASKLKAIKESWSDEKIQEIIEMNNQLLQWQATADTPEQQATLPALQLSDLTTSIPEIPTEARKLHNAVLLNHNLNTDGITYYDLYANVEDYQMEDFSVLGILLSLISQLRTEKYTASELNREIKSILGTFQATYNSGMTVTSRKNFFLVNVSWSSLDRNNHKAVELVREILLNTRFTDRQSILDIVRQNKMMMEQVFIAGGHGMGLLRATAYTNAAAATSEYFSGYNYYKFLSDLEKNWEEKADSFIEKLEEMYGSLFAEERITLSINNAEAQQLAEEVLSGLPHVSEIIPSEKKALGNLREGIITPSNVSFACSTADVSALEGIKIGTGLVLGNILSYDYLWNNIRVKGGAYGCGFNCRMAQRTRFYSYRDPSPANSLKIYDQTEEYLENFCTENDDVVKYIVGTVGDYDPLLSDRLKLKMADSDYFSETTNSLRNGILNEIISTTIEDIHDTLPIFAKTREDHNICVIGNKAGVEACRDQLKNIYFLGE